MTSTPAPEFFIAPGAPVSRSGGRRAFDIARDLGIAVVLIWTLPVGIAVVIALVKIAAAALTR